MFEYCVSVVKKFGWYLLLYPVIIGAVVVVVVVELPQKPVNDSQKR